MGNSDSSSYSDDDDDYVDDDDDLIGKINVVDICRALKVGAYRNIVVIFGPGVSQPIGIPEMQTECEGFYGLIERDYMVNKNYKVITQETFNEDPRPFYAVLGKLFETRVRRADFSDAHKFVKILSYRGMLRRLYTGNVDVIERRVGIKNN